MFEALLVEPRHALASQLKYKIETHIEKGIAPLFSKREILIGYYLSQDTPWLYSSNIVLKHTVEKWLAPFFSKGEILNGE